MREALALLIGALTLGAASPARPHHSFSAEFDVGRPVEFTGTVTRVEWTNPHAWIHLLVASEGGSLESWAVELLGINTLMRRGLTRESIKAGDMLTVAGYGARDGRNAANASVLIKPDTGEELWRSAAGDRPD